MIIKLKTNNLRIGKRKTNFWSSLEVEYVILRVNIPMLSDNIIEKMTYVFEKDFHGVKKNKSLIFIMKGRYIGNGEVCLNEILIPIEDNKNRS